jgi:hypothetical protein
MEEKVESPEQLLLVSSSKTDHDTNNNRIDHQKLLNLPCYGIIDMGESLLGIAVNNYSICCMYLKNINEAVKVMEELIQDNPTRYMTDAIVFNLCTMYDLTSSQEISGSKKKTLQQISNMFNVVDLHWRSFRLN